MTSYVRAMYDFSGEPGSSEISINVGEVLSVTRTDVGEGWWEGKNDKGEIGLFPAAYVEVMAMSDMPQQKNQEQRTKEDTNADNIGNNRYDHIIDEYTEGEEEWDDDWDDDNDTYSEIGISVNDNAKGPTTSASHSYSNYDKNLPAIPNDDVISLASNAPNNTTALKKSGMFGKASDSYILGLSKKDRLPESEMITIIQKDGIYHWKPDPRSYSVIVASPKKESKFKGMKTFIAYQLTPSFSNIPVSRRYKHFDWLHERLVEKFCLIPIPPLPDKQISGRYEEQFIEHRRVQLQEFVDWVCRHPVLSKCEVWYHFLTCTDDKIWKSGKRKAERDFYVGVTYCWAIMPPENQLLPSFIDSQMDTCSQFIHLMDSSVKNLLAIANETAKRYQTASKKDFQRIGDGLSDLAKALDTDERRLPSKACSTTLSESFGRIGGIFIAIGQLYADQPKSDWIPLSDRLHIYRGILNSFPDILSTHKGAMQKRKECERMAAEHKMSNQQMAEVNRRTDIISYAVMAEMSHFRIERESHLKQTLKSFIDEQINFYTNIVAKLQEAKRQIV